MVRSSSPTTARATCFSREYRVACPSSVSSPDCLEGSSGREGLVVPGEECLPDSEVLSLTRTHVS